MCNLEIVLCILRIPKLRANLEIARHQCAIPKLRANLDLSGTCKYRVRVREWVFPKQRKKLRKKLRKIALHTHSGLPQRSVGGIRIIIL